MQRRFTLLSPILATSLISSLVHAAPIPTEIKSVVAFVYSKNKDGDLVPSGTGFFVGVPNPNREGQHSVYLVTARHVVEHANGTGLVSAIFLRMNLKAGGSKVLSVPTRAKDGSLFPHLPKDDSVDLILFPLLPNTEKFDFKYLPLDMITTEQDYRDLKIREGTDVFFTGLFSPYPGPERNYPIVRFGRVALVTDEKIEWDGTPTDLYLIESGSYGGNSGSPVFFYLGSDRNPGSLVVGAPAIKLAGVMKGAFLDRHPLQFVEMKTVPLAPSNMGISAVVPAYKLHEFLLSEEVVKRRGF